MFGEDLDPFFFKKVTLSRGNIYLNPPLYFVIIFYFSTSIFFSSAPPQTKTAPLIWREMVQDDAISSVQF